MTITAPTVEALKIAGYFFAAGALARSMGHSRAYGCHIGMRSTRDSDANEFYRGWDARGC